MQSSSSARWRVIVGKVRIVLALVCASYLPGLCRSITSKASQPVIDNSNRPAVMKSTSSRTGNRFAAPWAPIRGGEGIRRGKMAEVGEEKLGAGLRPRESYHCARKVFHFTTISAFAVVYSSKMYRWDFVKGMAILDAWVVTSELARLRFEAVNRIVYRLFGPFMRAHEVKKFSGIMYCLAGLGATAALFPKHIALLGMLQLALGDPIAALVGHATRSVRWSRLRSGKGLLGAVGCACALTIANYTALVRAKFSGTPPPRVERFVAALLIGTWTATVEVSVPSPQKTLPYDSFPLAFDDNATLPVLGALGAALVFRCLGLSQCELRPWLLL